MTVAEDLRQAGADACEDNRIVRTAVWVLGGVLSLLAAVQAVLVLGVFSRTLRGVDGGPMLDVAVRVSVNVAVTGLTVVLVGFRRPESYAPRRRWSETALIAVIVGLVRCVLQVLAGIYPPSSLSALAVEFGGGLFITVLTCSAGFLLVRAGRRIREQERGHARVLLHAVEAVRALQEEELRVRREVAHDLHGRLQNTLVVLAAEIRAVASSAREGERLTGVADRLDGLREQEVRAAAGALYPLDIEHGLVPALRDLFARLPPEIAVDFMVADAFTALGAQRIPIDQRVLLARTVEEALTNALKHGGAAAVRLRLDVAAPETVVVQLDDDGRGLAPAARPSGLERLERQFTVYGGSLELHPSPDLGGARLVARLPLRSSA